MNFLVQGFESNTPPLSAFQWLPLRVRAPATDLPGFFGPIVPVKMAQEPEVPTSGRY